MQFSFTFPANRSSIHWHISIQGGRKYSTMQTNWKEEILHRNWRISNRRILGTKKPKYHDIYSIAGVVVQFLFAELSM